MFSFRMIGGIVDKVNFKGHKKQKKNANGVLRQSNMAYK